MLFSTIPFLFWFLPVALVAWAVASRAGLSRFALTALLGASWFSYAWFAPAGLLLLGGSIATNYWVAGRLATTQRAKPLLVAALALNLGVLGWFKYAGFFAQTANDLGVTRLDVPQIALPLGVSFFTLQQISYLVDVYRGQPPEQDPVRYALFISFFPHLIAGPIVLHNELLPQFRATPFRRIWQRNFTIGLSIFVFGLAKKVLIADRISPIADAAFSSAAAGVLQTVDAWLGVLAYTMQIYFDFSAYSDMAIGLAFCFGFRLPVNFKSPYKATSIVEFWRRWHITLSHFLRIYLYIALGGNRRGRVRRYVNLMLTMLIGGLWHGAGWTFVVWGALHGTYLIVNHALTAGTRSAQSRLPRVLGWIATMAGVMVAWVFFRAPSMADAFAVLKSMLGVHSTPIAAASSLATEGAEVEGAIAWGGLNVAVLVIGSVIALTAPNLTEVFRRYRPSLDIEPTPPTWAIAAVRYRPSAAWIMVTIACLIASVFAMEAATPFIYFAF